MIYSLHSLRVVFALCIFLHHLDLFEAGGSCGVSFFFVLSGFVLSSRYANIVTLPSFSWKRFILKRLIRLLPLHWITLLLAILIQTKICHEQLSGWPLLSNALMLQSWFPWYDYFFPVMLFRGISLIYYSVILHFPY